MAGRLVPLVVIPRFTSFAGYTGGSNYTTAPVDLTPYSRVILTLWRGKLVGSVFAVTCQESTDRNTWFTCAGENTSAYDPAASAGVEGEGVVVATLTRRWFRVRVALSNDGDEQVTCWAVGHGESREE